MGKLLTQNSELRPIRVWNWTLPAWVTTLPDGRSINACPSAGACVKLCYARNGTYLFPKVRAAHQRNLVMVLDDLAGWEEAMLQELSHRRYRYQNVVREVPGIDPWLLDADIRDWMLGGGAAVRVHDSGDFFNDEYLLAWMRIADAVPDVLFYAYTKEVSRFRRLAADSPANFRYLFSLGGKEDYLVDQENDRHADVFATAEEMVSNGYVSQDLSDLMAVLLPVNRIGITANNIPHIKKKMGGKAFSQIEQEMIRHVSI